MRGATALSLSTGTILRFDKLSALWKAGASTSSAPLSFR